jgi:SAM-dependent MidA family methyltransferase
MNQRHEPAAPTPSAAAQAHSERLAATLRDEIEAAGGAIPFRRYMEQALYAPGLGYYAAAGGDALARAGDFVTAPELSSVFARCLARQCAEVLNGLGGGDLLEPGAGSGALAAQLLLALEALDALPKRYRILEPSAELQTRQHATLTARAPHLVARVEWISAWPGAFAGVVLANEVLDAMPVEGFRITPDGPEQRCTRVQAGGALADTWRPAPAALARAIAHIEADLGRALPSGYVSEYQPTLGGWFAGLAESLQAGAVLLIDYGYVRQEYYLPERTMGTLVCTRAHGAHDDPYSWPGLTDITAFVDFTAVTEAATAAGFELEGFTPQAQFLIANGLASEAGAALAQADEREHLQTTQQIKRLTLPDAMGEKFNVIGFSRGLEARLSGFELQDLSRRL